MTDVVLQLITAMARMKIFRLVQTFYETLGIYSPQSNQVYSSKLRVLYFSTITILHIASMLGFLLFQAKTIQVCFFNFFRVFRYRISSSVIISQKKLQDFGICCYALVSMAKCLLDSVITMRRIPQILKFIELFDVFIENSKSFPIFYSLFHNFLINFPPTGSFHSHSVAMNNKLVERIERMSEMIHLILIKLSFSAVVISPLLVTVVNFFVFGMGDESFRFCGALWFPFDPNKPIGFFMASYTLSMLCHLCGILLFHTDCLCLCWFMLVHSNIPERSHNGYFTLETEEN